MGGGLCLFVCLCWGLFVLLFEDIRFFAFHLFSYKLRIVDQLQNVDDRQSLERARHGQKKKVLGWEVTFLFFFRWCFSIIDKRV